MNGTRVHRNMHGLEASDDALAGPCDALATLPTPLLWARTTVRGTHRFWLAHPRDS